MTKFVVGNFTQAAEYH